MVHVSASIRLYAMVNMRQETLRFLRYELTDVRHIFMEPFRRPILIGSSTALLSFVSIRCAVRFWLFWRLTGTRVYFMTDKM